VLGYALRRADTEEARDVAAETFLVAWRRLEAVPAGDAALPWLLATARRVLANRRRSAATQARFLDAPHTTQSADPADGVAARSALAAAFNHLSPNDREALALIAWDGLRPREASVVLGCSAATFAVRAHRARRRLAALLEAGDGTRAVHIQGGQT
jgi:RNA polymerase sigma-70 factor, ECF subfamily